MVLLGLIAMGSQLFLIGLVLILAACAQPQLVLDDATFSQKRMAHSVGLGTMYLTSSTQDGDHNCDDSPSTCCASGYHLCSVSEVLHGGREVEGTGTDRDTTTHAVNGWVDAFSESTATDCSGYTSVNGAHIGMQCLVSTTAVCSASLSQLCNGADPVWCCSQ